MVIYDWDRAKANQNIRRRGISFEEAKTVFFDPFAITLADEYHSDEEVRFIDIGISARGRLLVVIHTERRGWNGAVVVRIISCRAATAGEHKRYAED